MSEFAAVVAFDLSLPVVFLASRARFRSSLDFVRLRFPVSPASGFAL